MAQIQATQLRKGMAIMHNGNLVRIIETRHVTPGNWRGMVQAKMKNIETGSNVEYRFRSEDRVDQVVLEKKTMEYLYQEGDHYVFMDHETYDQIHIPADLLGDSILYVVPNTTIEVEFHGTKPIGIEVALTVDLKVVETEPGLKGATVTNTLKPAKMETGLTVQVPSFVDVGDVIRIDTNTGEYLSRA